VTQAASVAWSVVVFFSAKQFSVYTYKSFNVLFSWS